MRRMGLDGKGAGEGARGIDGIRVVTVVKSGYSRSGRHTNERDQGFAEAI